MRATGLESSIHYTYRREVYASGQEVFMTQRVARPMKFAAFISIIISVAVMFAACQGAVGPKGDPGADGTDGTDGTPGRDAFIPLTLKPTTPMAVITDATDADDEPVAGAAKAIDLADYVHGSAPRTYGKPSSSILVAAMQVFDAKLDGSVLTITPKKDQPAQESERYVLETFTVKISDGGESVDQHLMIPARRNRKPTNAAAVTGTVGSQAPEKAPDPIPACADIDDIIANECYLADITFIDGDTLLEELSFTATSADTSKVEVISVDNAPGQNADDPAMPLVARLVVRGVASTFAPSVDTDPNSDGIQADHKGVVVTVIATDQGGATAKGEATIEVDGAPQPDGTIPARTIKVSNVAQSVLTNVASFFKDPESETLSFVATTEDTKVIASITDIAGADGLFPLMVTTNGTGSATITITATEAAGSDEPQQTVKQTLALTVTE